MSTVLITGGAGYIGTHTVLEMLQQVKKVVVLDNFCNSSVESIKRVQHITGKTVEVIEGDVRDRQLLDRLFAFHPIDAVVHFAGLKAVGDSVRDPLAYYDNNVHGSLTLFKAMELAGVFRLIFSSSATVYGEPKEVPITEDFPTVKPASPYGYSKLMVEQMLQDITAADPRWSIGILRYFNPIGAHESGLIGEDPQGIPNNLLPYISQVAMGQRESLAIFGNDYPTPDGTGVRDYIHVMDLAAGHSAALAYLDRQPGLHTWNLGSGVGYSVLQIIQAFKAVSGCQIPCHIAPRRFGDLAAYWSSPAKANAQLGWQAKRTLIDMVRDAWHWQQKNPSGYC